MSKCRRCSPLLGNYFNIEIKVRRNSVFYCSFRATTYNTGSRTAAAARMAQGRTAKTTLNLTMGRRDSTLTCRSARSPFQGSALGMKMIQICLKMLTHALFNSNCFSLRNTAHLSLQGSITTAGFPSRHFLLLKLGPNMNIDSRIGIGFDSNEYLTGFRSGKRVIQLQRNQAFFSQGATADSVFYIHSGNAKLTVVSKLGKEATIMLLTAGDFVGEESIAEGLFRSSTASTTTVCTVVRIEREEMLRALREEPNFSTLFLSYMLRRSERTQADLIDHLFNSSERRLARILLLMADCGKPGEAETLIPPITQETLAEMIGTTRSRVSFFMNRFRKLGYIEYKRRIRVHKSLRNVVLRDQNSIGVDPSDTFIGSKSPGPFPLNGLTFHARIPSAG
jgi:CRP/FNR family transcriptional regulator, cyclic AMP receptor protein